MKATDGRARPDFLDNSMIVGAHPDDELLWFTSILRQVDEVVIVFSDFWGQPGIGERRRAAIADYPRANVTCLDLAEAGAYGCADWTKPVPSPYGITLGLEANRREITRLARKSVARLPVVTLATVASDSVARAYEANYHALYRALRERVRPGMNVFTHNPWGEYGHEEHVQVFRVLERLRGEVGFRLWMSNYCTERAMPLAMRYFDRCPGGYVRLPADKAFADKVAGLYRRHDCWTWADDWAWFDEECFMEAPSEDSEPQSHRHLFPLNFFTIDAAQSRKWLPIALSMSVASAAIGVTLADAI